MNQSKPLGLKLNVQREVERKLAMIESWDMSLVKKRAVKDGLLSVDEIEEVELEFKRYLALPLLFPHDEAAPCEKVDHLWHTFLLFTRDYRHFCEQIYGYFLDHVPNTDNL